MSDYTTSPEMRSFPPPAPLVEQDWDRVVQMLPADIEATARAAQALQRRREVRSAQDLLRMVFAYAWCDWPLRLVGAWFLLLGRGNLSDVAVLQRLRAARRWVGQLLATWLLGVQLAAPLPAVRLRLVDATVLCQPGSQGTDWRVHLSLNLGQLGFDGVEVTDGTGGETLARFSFQPGDILVADRGYARRPGLGTALATGSHLVVRIGWQNVPLQDAAQGAALDLLPWLRQLPPTGPGQQEVWLQTPQGCFPVRLVACRLPEEAAATARRKLRREATRKGRTPKAASLEAAGYLLVVTNLPAAAWSAAQVLALYRIRWQVELAIKRLKGLWQLDHLRAKDPDLAQTYLLGKLLGALLSAALTGRGRAVAPYLDSNPARPLSLWRLERLWFEGLRRAVVGQITPEMILAALPQLYRYLQDAPRKKRPQQLATALAWLRELNDPLPPPATLTIPALVEHEMALS
jgi:hypothetical protein